MSTWQWALLQDSRVHAVQVRSTKKVTVRCSNEQAYPQVRSFKFVWDSPTAAEQDHATLCLTCVRLVNRDVIESTTGGLIQVFSGTPDAPGPLLVEMQAEETGIGNTLTGKGWVKHTGVAEFASLSDGVSVRFFTFVHKSAVTIGDELRVSLTIDDV